MKRKIVKQGAATLTISLPSKWTKKFNLKAGDEIEVDEKESYLLISGSGESATKASKIILGKMPKALAYRQIIAAYKKGSNEINMTFDSNEIEDIKANKKVKTLDFIQQTVDKLIGVEIIEQGKNYCKIKQITDIAEQEFDNVLRRTFLLLLTLSEEAIEISSGKSKDTSIVENKHNNIDKFVNYSIRLLNKKGIEEKTTFYYYLIQELEEISDAYTFLSKEITMRKWNADKKTVDAFSLVNSSLRTLYEYFYDFKTEKSIKILKDRRKFFDYVESAAKTGKIADNIILSRLSVIIVRILNLVETRISME